MYTAILDDGTRLHCHTYDYKEGGVVLLNEGGRRLAFVPNTSLNFVVQDVMEAEAGDKGTVWRQPER